MSKFKVGDKVRICKCEPVNVWPHWIEKIMDKYVGEIVTISEIIDEVGYDVEENCWTWHENWLEPVNFTLNDVKEFDIFELQDGRMFLVTYDWVVNDLAAGGYPLGDWNDKFIGIGPESNVVKIYRPTESVPINRDEWESLPIIWETEPKEMTLEEISEILGYKVKIVKGD